MARVGFLALLVCAYGCASSGRPGRPDGGAGGATGGSSGTGGGGGQAGGGNVVVGLPMTTACATLNSRRCDYYARCGLIADTEDARHDCAAWLLDTWCGPERWPSRVEVGTLLYDGKLAQQCADAFSGRLCEDFEVLPGVCNRFTAPNVSPLDACYDGYPECTEGRVCRGAACPRTCQQLGMAGDSCQLDTDCRPLLFCKRAVMVTGAGSCTNFGVAGSVCGRDEPCGAGLSCASGKCLQPPSSGSACAAGNLCDDGSWCQPAADGGMCVNRLGLAASCTDDVQCAAGYLCLEGACQPRVLGLLPSACSDRQTCPSNTTCVGATGTQQGLCEPPLKAGVSCIASDDCHRHLACAPADAGSPRECAFRVTNLSRCSTDRDCQLLSRCKMGACKRLPLTGESCRDEGTCLFGPCQYMNDGGARCAEKYGPGTRCTFDGECASNRCSGGICLPSCAP